MDERTRVRLASWGTSIANSVDHVQITSLLRIFRELVVVIILVVLSIVVLVISGIHDTDALKTLLTDVRDIMSLLTEAIAVLVIVMLILVLIGWMSSKKRSIVILPFEDATGDGKYNGKAIADLLIATLLQIIQIHNAEHDLDEPDIAFGSSSKFSHPRNNIQKKDKSYRVTNRSVLPLKREPYKISEKSITLPLMTTERESLDTNISSIGTVAVGGATISLGSILNILRSIWPLGDSGTIISGTLQRYGSKLELVARLQHKTCQAWEITRTIEQDNIATLLPEMVEELAYKLAREVISQKEMGWSWQGYKCFTEALKSLDQYNATKSAEALEALYQNCLQARRDEPTNSDLSGLFYQLGIAYLHTNTPEYARSEEMFLNAIALDPADVVGYLGLGALYQKWDRLDDALMAYTSAVGVAPGDYRAHSELGRFLTSASLSELAAKQAVEELQAAVRRAPLEAKSLYLLGNAYYNQGKMSDAREQLLLSVWLRADDAQAHSLLGQVYMNEENWNEAEKEFWIAIRKDPSMAEPYYGLGTLCTQKGDAGAALSMYKWAVQFDPSDPIRHNNLGAFFANSKRVEEAIQEYQQALELDSSLVIAYENLGFALVGTGQVDEAINVLQEATHRDPQNADLRNGLGFTCLNAGRMDDAISEFQSAASLAPENFDTHFYLGVAFTRTGNDACAGREFETAIRLDPKNADLHNAIGFTYLSVDRTEEAVREFQCGLSLDPNNSNAYVNLGHVHRLADRVDEALASLGKAVALNTLNAEAHYGICTVYAYQQRYQEAIAECQQAVYSDSDTVANNVTLAALYRAVGDESNWAQNIQLAHENERAPSTYDRACFHAVSGNAVKALSLLEAALARKEVSRLWARHDADFSSLYDDIRFRALVCPSPNVQ